MLARWSTKIATAAPAAKATTGQEAPKSKANMGSVTAETIEATEV